MPSVSEIVEYTFSFEDSDLVFVIETSEKKSEPPQSKGHNSRLPQWTRLEKNQCECCPLKLEETKHCPAALRVHDVLDAFEGHRSFDKVNLKVVTSRRVFQQECDLQSGLNSMLGLQMATSGCPCLSPLRSMATFHIPFCSFDETLYRTVSSYLVKQFFIYKAGGHPDWDLKDLKEYYRTLEVLNHAFSKRIRVLKQSGDAASNSVIMFFSTSSVLADLLESDLEDYKSYFTGESIQPPSQP